MKTAGLAYFVRWGPGGHETVPSDGCSPRRAMLDCQVLEKSPGHKEGETVSLPLPPQIVLCWY